MPSSSLVKVEVGVSLEVEVGVGVGVEVGGVWVGVGHTFSVGWVGAWLEILRVKLISTHVVVEVGVELGNKAISAKLSWSWGMGGAL